MTMPRKVRCGVESIHALGGGVYVADLKPEGPVPMFKAGQFLHLTLDEYSPSQHWPESRAFSIASSPDRRERVRICYSVKGRYTLRMESELEVGKTVWIKLPFGDFFIDESRDVVLLAGGTGFSAFSAFIGNLRPDHAHDVFLVYGVRSPAHWLFQELVMEKLKTVPRFRCTLICANADASFPAVPAELAGRLEYEVADRIDPNRFWPRLQNPAAYLFYLSGPPVMLTSLSAALRAKQVTAESIKIDAWS
jgi:NAD(P)H-flavin reductase